MRKQKNGSENEAGRGVTKRKRRDGIERRKRREDG